MNTPALVMTIIVFLLLYYRGGLKWWEAAIFGILWPLGLGALIYYRFLKPYVTGVGTGEKSLKTTYIDLGGWLVTTAIVAVTFVWLGG